MSTITYQDRRRNYRRHRYSLMRQGPPSSCCMPSQRSQASTDGELDRATDLREQANGGGLVQAASSQGGSFRKLRLGGKELVGSFRRSKEKLLGKSPKEGGKCAAPVGAPSPSAGVAPNVHSAVALAASSGRGVLERAGALPAGPSLSGRTSADLDATPRATSGDATPSTDEQADEVPMEEPLSSLRSPPSVLGAATPAAPAAATSTATPAATPGATRAATPAAPPVATPGATPAATPELSGISVEEASTPGCLASAQASQEISAATAAAIPAAIPAAAPAATPAAIPAAAIPALLPTEGETDSSGEALGGGSPPVEPAGRLHRRTTEERLQDWARSTFEFGGSQLSTAHVPVVDWNSLVGHRYLGSGKSHSHLSASVPKPPHHTSAPPSPIHQFAPPAPPRAPHAPHVPPRGLPRHTRSSPARLAAPRRVLHRELSDARWHASGYQGVIPGAPVRARTPVRAGGWGEGSGLRFARRTVIHRCCERCTATTRSLSPTSRARRRS